MAKKQQSKDSFLAEHKKLIDVLRKGTKKEREEEARRQRKEVNEKKRGK